MEQWAWVELQAQVEDNGSSAVKFYLFDQPDPETGDNMELTVKDILFEDDVIKVVLE